jgi:hypothetical protein
MRSPNENRQMSIKETGGCPSGPNSMTTKTGTLRIIVVLIVTSLMLSCATTCVLSAIGYSVTISWRYLWLTTCAGKTSVNRPIPMFEIDSTWIPKVRCVKVTNSAWPYLLGASIPPRYFSGPAIEIPNWMFLTLSLIVGLIALQIGKLGRSPPYWCSSKCRYRLHGNLSGFCPECGTRIPPRISQTSLNRKLVRHFFMLNLLVMAIISSGILLGIARLLDPSNDFSTTITFDPTYDQYGTGALIILLATIPNCLFQYYFVGSATKAKKLTQPVSRHFLLFFRLWKRVYYYGIPQLILVLAAYIGYVLCDDEAIFWFIIPIWVSYLYFGARKVSKHPGKRSEPDWHVVECFVECN